MALQVVALLTRSLSALLGWLQDIWSATGLQPIYMYAVVVIMASRFILAPLFAVHGSDKARRKED